MIPVAGGEAQSQVAPFEHGTTDLCIAVLEGEIPVSGGWSDEVTDLTLDPDKVKMALQQASSLPVELADGQGRGWWGSLE